MGECETRTQEALVAALRARPRTPYRAGQCVLVAKASPFSSLLRRDQPQPGKVGALASRVPCDQYHAFHHRVGPDEEVGERGALVSAGPPIPKERCASQECGLPGDWEPGESAGWQGLLYVLDPLETYGHLGVDHWIHGQNGGLGALGQGSSGPGVPDRILCQDVQQHAGIH